MFTVEVRDWNGALIAKGDLYPRWLTDGALNGGITVIRCNAVDPGDISYLNITITATDATEATETIEVVGP